jgi:K+-transporting ATPase KdpF subunit
MNVFETTALVLAVLLLIYLAVAMLAPESFE